MLVKKDLNKHLESNLQWAETLSDDLLNVYASTTKNQNVNANELDLEGLYKLFGEVSENMVFTDQQGTKETNIAYEESDFFVPHPLSEKLKLRHNLDVYEENGNDK